MKLRILLMILPFMVACQNKKVDWDKITMPISLDSLSNEHEILPYYENYGDFNLHKTFDKNLLNIFDTNFAAKVLTDNSIVFYVSKNYKKIEAITLFTEDIPNTEKLLEMIEMNLGKTDYHYYDGSNEKVTLTEKIWEKGDKFYTLTYKSPDYIFGEKTKTTHFTVFSKSSKDFIKWWFNDGGEFSGFYGQYLEERKKAAHQNKKYTYKDFVAQMDQEGKNYGLTSHNFVK